MLTLKQLRENKEEAIRRLAKKGVDAAPIIATIELLDDKRRLYRTSSIAVLPSRTRQQSRLACLWARVLRRRLRLRNRRSQH
jgi:seryl-tRNA synthetase